MTFNIHACSHHITDTLKIQNTTSDENNTMIGGKSK